jgi:UDP-arabinose 4-epimerase
MADIGWACGLRSVSLRYLDGCGAEPAGAVGERHGPEPHILPRALIAAAGQLPLFELLGTHYPTRDGPRCVATPCDRPG